MEFGDRLRATTQPVLETGARDLPGYPAPRTGSRLDPPGGFGLPDEEAGLPGSRWRSSASERPVRGGSRGWTGEVGGTGGALDEPIGSRLPGEPPAGARGTTASGLPFLGTPGLPGRGGSEHRTRYRIPSSEAFDVDVPCAPGLIEGMEDDR
jgi:hypothetical protein